MVEQLGLAMIPLFHLISSGLTSGTTSGTSGSIRQALELSITMQPLDAAIGANFKLVEPPADIRTMSISLSKEFSVSSSMVCSLPIKVIFVPAERLEAKR